MGKINIIAEIGVNHNGNLTLAKEMIDAAKNAGADIVKFQTFKAGNLSSSMAKMAKYQVKNLGCNISQKEMLKRFELTDNDYLELISYCSQKEIEFLSSPFDIESVNLLNKLGCQKWKIPSGQITDYPYLVRMARTLQPIILSTGMSTIKEIEQALRVLQRYGTKDITLLHCTSQYPTLYKDVNLRAMLTLKRYFNINVGYSDHTVGYEVPIAAVAMGASVIEKHFTLSRELEGPDQIASLEPEEFSQMVQSIRNIELSLGDGEKKPMPSELENIYIVRKSIVASQCIQKGDIFSEDNITTKRPGYGISPMRWDEIIGQTAKKNYTEDELIV